jgi:conjugal transfer/entry exclusion protein
LSRAFPHVHAACAATLPQALPPSGPLRMARMPLLSTRQNVQAFNQPLSLNTSKVTNMVGMFAVRSARALWPPGLESGLPRARRFHCRRPRPSRLPETAPRPASHVPLPLTRQAMRDFNQLLSFDTSQVTDMHSMFSVRSSARALAPKP